MTPHPKSTTNRDQVFKHGSQRRTFSFKPHDPNETWQAAKTLMENRPAQRTCQLLLCLLVQGSRCLPLENIPQYTAYPAFDTSVAVQTMPVTPDVFKSFAKLQAIAMERTWDKTLK